MHPGDLGLILLQCPVALGMEGHDCNGPDCNCGSTILTPDAWVYVNRQGADAEDAARWRALMSSQRVRVIGSAGLVDPTTGNLRMPPDGYIHIGIELWSLHNAPHPSKDFPQDRCREQLTFYADFLRLWPPVERPPIPSGVYYRAESDNFYDMTANVGMGMGFWRKWRDRKHDFPTERGAST
jgi:hypothetical protein